MLVLTIVLQQKDLWNLMDKGAKMRRVMLLLVGVILLFGLQGQAVWAANVKIGVLDMKRLQQKSKVFQKVREELKKKFEALQRKLEQEKDQIRKIEQELRKQSMMLSLDAKQDKQRELEKRSRHYKFMYGEVAQDMKDAEIDATRKVGVEIEKVVEGIAKKEGFTIILEEGTMGLIYYDEAIDITDQVTRAYDNLKR